MKQLEQVDFIREAPNRISSLGFVCFFQVPAGIPFPALPLLISTFPLSGASLHSSVSFSEARRHKEVSVSNAGHCASKPECFLGFAKSHMSFSLATNDGRCSPAATFITSSLHPNVFSFSAATVTVLAVVAFVVIISGYPWLLKPRCSNHLERRDDKKADQEWQHGERTNN